MSIQNTTYLVRQYVGHAKKTFMCKGFVIFLSYHSHFSFFSFIMTPENLLKSSNIRLCIHNFFTLVLMDIIILLSFIYIETKGNNPFRAIRRIFKMAFDGLF